MVGVGFEVTGNVTFQESSFYNMYYCIKKLIITHQEPIKGIKVWILLGYPNNILGYLCKYCNYTAKKKL